MFSTTLAPTLSIKPPAVTAPAIQVAKAAPASTTTVTKTANVVGVKPALTNNLIQQNANLLTTRVGNLKESLVELKDHAAQAVAGLDQVLGPGVRAPTAGIAGSQLSALRGMGVTGGNQLQSLLGNPAGPSGMTGGHSSQASEGAVTVGHEVLTSAGAGVAAAEMGALPLTAILGGGTAGAGAVVGAATGLGTAFFTGYTIGTAINEGVDAVTGEKGWIGTAVGGVWGDLMFALEDEPGSGDGEEGGDAGEPLPDDTTTSGAPKVITAQDIKSLNAKMGAAGEPTGEASGSGGTLNTGVNGTGKGASQSEYVNDVGNGAGISQFDLKNIEARAVSKFSPVADQAGQTSMGTNMGGTGPFGGGMGGIPGTAPIGFGSVAPQTSSVAGNTGGATATVSVRLISNVGAEVVSSNVQAAAVQVTAAGLR